MMSFLTGKIWGALAAAGTVLALVGAAFLKGRAQGQDDVNDEMQDAYNSTTKDLHHDKAIRPTGPDAVLERLHGYAERGDGGSDT